MGRKRVYDDALRLRLLDRAGEIVSAQGVDALSLRGLAADVGTTTAAVYTLFGGKPGLLAALYAEAFARFGAHLAAVSPTDDPVVDVLALGRAYRESALADPHYYRVMFGSDLTPEDLPAEIGDAAAQTFLPLVEAIGRGIDAGMFAPVDPALAATALWANVHGLVSLELGRFLPPQAGEPAEVFDLAIRNATAGWLSQAPRA